MKKLKLDLESVQVESFDTSGTQEQPGTVHGQISIAVSCYGTDCCSDVSDCCPVDTSYCSQNQWSLCCQTGITCPGGSTCAVSCHTGLCACY
jgi:hypothetical protein